MNKELLVNEGYEVEGYTEDEPKQFCDTTANDCAQDCIFSTSIYTVQN